MTFLIEFLLSWLGPIYKPQCSVSVTDANYHFHGINMNSRSDCTLYRYYFNHTNMMFSSFSIDECYLGGCFYQVHSKHYALLSSYD